MGTDGLCELFWHNGWDLRCDHGSDDSVDILWGEDSAQDCALESDFVIVFALSSIGLDGSDGMTTDKSVILFVESDNSQTRPAVPRLSTM